MFYEYNRLNAVEYAMRWALGRNPKYMDYEDLGGDCTNFISQCMHAGEIPMDNIGKNIITQWYWYSDRDRTPSWTGAQFFYNYFLKNNSSDTSNFGAYASYTDYNSLELGDLVQLIDNDRAYHTMIITDIIYDGDEVVDYLVCQHSMDLLNYPLSLKIGEKRYIKIFGYYK